MEILVHNKQQSKKKIKCTQKKSEYWAMWKPAKQTMHLLTIVNSTE